MKGGRNERELDEILNIEDSLKDNFVLFLEQDKPHPPLKNLKILTG